MKIIFKQDKSDPHSLLNRFNLDNCSFREFYINKSVPEQTHRTHKHINFELHFVIDGFQEYEINKKLYSLPSGSFLLIPPNVPHRALQVKNKFLKIGVSFKYPEQSIKNLDIISGAITEGMLMNITNIRRESVNDSELSNAIIESNIFQLIFSVLQIMGLHEKPTKSNDDDHPIILYAKQFISDNIEQPPNVSDVAKYCHLSTKQLTRIFKKYELMSPGEYIIKTRGQYVESLLTETNLTLKQISEKMNFSSEYYFHSFFKAHSGMTPRDYKRMNTK